MHINKITIWLAVIYVIINAFLVIDLSKRLGDTEETLASVSAQTNASTMLLLAHVELHRLERNQNNIERYDNLLHIFPKKKYD